MAEGDTAAPANQVPGWREHLDFAVARPDHTVVLGDIDPANALALRVRCQRPRDLLHLARALIEHAQDVIEHAPSRDDVGLAQVVKDALAILPEAGA